MGPTINTASDDHCVFIPPDENRLIFVSNHPGGLGAGDFYISHRDGRDKRNDFAWGPPEPIGALNTTFDEFGPWAFEVEGTDTLSFYFGSNRPGGLGGYDIYNSTVAEDGTFSPPVLVPELSSPLSDTFPVARKDGLELFLTSNRTGTLGGLDLWVARRENTSDPWSTPVNVGSLNSTANDQRAALSWDGMTIIFFSNRSGGFGNADLYESTRTKLRSGNN